MDEALLKAAQALVSSGKTDAEKRFDIENTNEEVVIRVVRRRKGGPVTLTEKTAVSFFGSGNVCTSCGGTGRV